jgi:orotate phosphoribosyltransferase
MYDYDLVLKALKTHAIKYGDFTLSNGKKSDHYFDVKSVLCNSIALYRITELIHETAANKQFVYDRIAGMESGATPLVVSLSQSYEAKYDFVIVRKPKEHGIVKKYEGRLELGDRVLVLEDVVTTGQSVLNVCKVIEDAGAIISGIISVIDREDEKIEEFKKYEDRYVPLFKKSDLI